MTGHSAFKQLRIDTGLTIRNFAASAGIAPRTLTYYENGEKSLLNMPVEKALTIFSFFPVNVSEFYYENYPIKSVTNVRIDQWKANHNRETNKEIIRGRLKNRIYKLKERSRYDEYIEQILVEFEKQMTLLYNHTESRQNITEEEYLQYVSPVLYLLKKPPGEHITDPVLATVMEAYYHSEYSFADLSYLSGVSQQHLKERFSKNELLRLHIETMLVLCICLGLDFDEVFKSEKSRIEKQMK